METSTNGVAAAGEAAASPEDQGRVAEVLIGPGRRAAPEVLGRERVPDPELVEQDKRRPFTAEYKARILAEADAARVWARSAGCSAGRGCTRRI
jgi:hypothetical protein